jgi:hypothetical protein
MLIQTYKSHRLSLVLIPECLHGILKELRGKGVVYPFTQYAKGEANHYYTGNPTQRTDHLSISLSPYQDKELTGKIDHKSLARIDSILNSPVLMKSWTDRIVLSCKNIASVDFSMHGTDIGASYAIQENGKTKKRECREYSESQDWNYRYCA